MPRILSIDYGRKRVGIAVTDPAMIVAQGLTTLTPDKVNAFLREYIPREQVNTIVLGWPTRLDNSMSETTLMVERFYVSLRSIFPKVLIVKQDERYTSIMAQQAMIDGGMKKKDRQNKAMVDQIAATIILQEYLEQQRNNLNR